MDFITWGYFGLFLATFLSATIIPFSSEIIVVVYLLNGFNPIVVFSIAGVGNSMGSIFNFEIGRLGNLNWQKKTRNAQQKTLRWRNKIQKYGHWLALLAWTPIAGDLISLALGYFKAKRLPTYCLITLGKFARYGIIILGFYYFK